MVADGPMTREEAVEVLESFRRSLCDDADAPKKEHFLPVGHADALEALTLAIEALQYRHDQREAERRHVAALALSGIMASSPASLRFSLVARDAIEAADVLLAALDEREKEESGG